MDGIEKNINVGKLPPLRNTAERLLDSPELKIIKSSLKEFTKIPENQAAIATFYANSSAVFDIGSYLPGTIIRRSRIEPFDTKIHYQWYIVGKKDSERVNLYFVYYPGGEDEKEFGDKEILFPAKTLTIYGQKYPNKAFAVSEGELYFNGEPIVPGFETVQIDIMSLGSHSKYRVTNFFRKTARRPTALNQAI